MDFNLVKYLMIYGISAVSFLIIDFFWLAKVAPKLYKDNIGHLMADKPNIGAAAVFYTIFLIGLLVFVIVPALQKSSLMHAGLYGAVFGVVTYATFGLTSQAVFKDWPTKISVIDMLWGAFLCAVVSIITYFIAQKIF